MSEVKNSTAKSALTAGTLLGIVLIVYSLIIYFIGFSTNKYMGYLSYLVIVVGIILLQIQYRDKELKGTMSYGKAFGFAVLTLLFAGIISSIFAFVQIKFIDPGIIDKILSMSEEQMAKKGFTSEQIEAGLNMSRKFVSPLMLSVIGFIGMMFWGTLLSLVTSAFTRKEGTPFAGQ